jgi:hypothetical protein
MRGFFKVRIEDEWSDGGGLKGAIDVFLEGGEVFRG